MKFFKENKNISSEKYSRAYRLYNDIFEISVEKIIETKIVDTILRDRLNSIKELSNALIR